MLVSPPYKVIIERLNRYYLLRALESHRSNATYVKILQCVLYSTDSQTTNLQTVHQALPHPRENKIESMWRVQTSVQGLTLDSCLLRLGNRRGFLAVLVRQ